MSSESESDPILDLVSLIYDAVEEASRWQSFLDALVATIGASKATMVIYDAYRHGQWAAICWHGWSKEDIQLYNEQYGSDDPWALGATPLPEGFVGPDHAACEREKMEQSRAFREFYAPRNAVHGIGAIILITESGRSAFAAVRSKEQGPFGEHEVAVVRKLMPHLRRAALLHGRMGLLSRQLAMFTGHLNRYSHALVLADVDARILYANPLARQMMSEKDGLEEQEQSLTISPRVMNEEFRGMVAQVAARRSSLRSMPVPRPSRKSPYRLMVMPVEDSGAIPLGASIPAVSVLIIDPELQGPPETELLRQAFSLTPGEARVARRLVLGESVEEISGKLGVTVDTVRTHVKRILSKTSTQRQGELISLVLRSVPVLRLQ